jgi:hypothetical protein
LGWVNIHCWVNTKNFFTLASILSAGHCCNYCHLIAQLKELTQQKFLFHTSTVSNPAMFPMVRKHMLDIAYHTDLHIHTCSLRPLCHIRTYYNELKGCVTSYCKKDNTNIPQLINTNSYMKFSSLKTMPGKNTLIILLWFSEVQRVKYFSYKWTPD